MKETFINFKILAMAQKIYKCSLTAPDGTVIPMGTYYESQLEDTKLKAEAYVKDILNLPNSVSTWNGNTYFGIFRWDAFEVI